MADESHGAPEAPKTEEQLKQEDVQVRSAAFVKEYGELVQKHGIDFATYPVCTPIPNSPGYFGLVMQNTPVDVRNQPVKSPVQNNDIILDSSK